MTRWMASRALRRSALSIAALAGASMLVGFAAWGEDTKPAQPDSSLIAEGEYLPIPGTQRGLMRPLHVAVKADRSDKASRTG